MKINILVVIIAAIVIGVCTWLTVGSKNQLADLNRYLADAQSRAAQAGDELIKLKDLTGSQRTELENLKDKNNALTDRLANQQDRRSQLETGLSGSEQLLSAARNEASSLKLEAERLLAKEKETREHAGNLEKESRQLKASLTAAETLIKNLEAASTGAPLPALVCPPPDAEKNKEQATNEIARLKLESTRTAAELSSLRQQLGRDHNRLAAMKKELALFAAEHGNRPDEPTNTKEAYTRLTHDLQNFISSDKLIASVSGDQLHLTFSADIFFADGGPDLTPEGMRVLDIVAASIKNLPDKQVKISSHTDDQLIAKAYQRKFSSNWELSAARSSVIAGYFQNKDGISPDTLEAVGKASYEPVAPNDTPENRSKNRRLEIIVSNLK